ncbi:hypothetical protein PJ267_03110 [Arthrobacter sp. OVS8]|nr:hypothetical protein PJ267_03110 [Arthrobacter sp. OVS8]
MKNYTLDDSFTVTEDVQLVSRRIVDHLSSAGLRPNETQDGIEVRAGSDLLIRLLGIPLGSKWLPVGIDVHVAEDEQATTVTSAAYDRLGWYVNKKLMWGEDVLNRRLTELLNEVRTALGKPELPQGSATFSS